MGFIRSSDRQLSMSRDWFSSTIRDGSPPLALQIQNAGATLLHTLRFQSLRACCQRQTQEVDPEASVLEPRRTQPFSGFIESSRNVLKADELGREIASVALPAFFGLAADPLASLVDTAFIGQLGSVELAAVGVSISVFNLISKVFNLPLLNITTSYVAEDNVLGGDSSQEELTAFGDGECSEQEKTQERRVLPSVSSALFLGSSLGLLETIVLLAATWPILKLMGILEDSPMRLPAQQYLALRALGAPAVVVSLATQGVFRGFKDTKTPLYATVTGNLINIVLVPVLMFSLGYGVRGAAVATVVSEYFIAFLLLWKLNKLVILVPPDLSSLGLDRFFKSGGLLFTRTISILLTMTLATSMAAHKGVAPMAAHQICMQIWLAASLLSDSLALAGQAVIADLFARKNGDKVKEATFRVLQLGAGLGLVMAGALALGGRPFTRLFTHDELVIQALLTIFPFAVFTQPINSLAFVFDGVLYGATDFAYAAFSMVILFLSRVYERLSRLVSVQVAIGVVSSGFLLAASASIGLPGVWLGLTLLMTLRMAAGFLRLGSATGPWQFLASERMEIDTQ